MKKATTIIVLISLTMLSGCLSGGDETISADTVLDDQIYEEAVSSTNIEKCKDILNSAKENECKEVVESLEITKQAKTNADKSICSEIVLERYRENCESTVEIKINEEQERENQIQEREALTEEAVKIGQKAMEEEDSDVCEDIEDTNQKTSCKYNVIANQAIKENDPSLCEAIGDESSIEVCKKSVPTN